MAGNKNLRKADGAKNDEFYTQLSDIERELKHYKEHFKGKTVFCNCDDPYESNFFKYFALNFNFLGLKKLIAICYAGSKISNKQLSLFDNESPANKTTKSAHKIEITEIKEEPIGLSVVADLLRNKKNVLTKLRGDGDFRSSESIKLLREADIVVTNPPFSLFREYVAQLIEYNKSFVIVGNQNAICYKEIFPLIKADKLWLGYGFSGGAGHFINHHYEDYAAASNHKEGMIRVSGVVWFTNLEIKKRHEDLMLYKTYNAKEYPKYDNYDAINIDKTKDIPCDYDGAMGVPITFLDKYSPDQFEIIDGIGRYSVLDNEKTKKEGKYLSMIDGNAKYFRLIVRKKNEN